MYVCESVDPNKNEVSLIFLLVLNKIFLIHEKKKRKAV